MNALRMVCRELEPFVYPYLDGELELEERVEIEAHLASCPECARRVEEERALKNVVRLGGQTRAPGHLRDVIAQGLHETHRRERALRWLKISAAAAVVISVSGGVVYQRHAAVRQRYLADAAIRHGKKLPDEVTPPTPDAIEAWFDGKLDYRVKVPALTNAKVTGARLSNVRDMPAAYISYEAQPVPGEARRVGLFVMDDDKGELSAEAWPDVEVTQSHGYNVATWRQGEMVYELVSDLEPGEIRQLLAMPTVPSVHPSGMATASAPLPAPSLNVQPASLQR
jgi:mycothiol system anti-sigma-R factor